MGGNGPRRVVAALLTCVLGGAATTAATLAVPVPAYAACTNAAPAPAESVADTPWAQARYGLDRLVGIADGSGVKVAVIDSGVDARHPQLVGAVDGGFDAADLGPSGTGAATAGQLDCVGHGTAVASVIAGRPVSGVAFRGVAPGAKIIPIRVSENLELDGHSVGRGSLKGLAEGIRYAVATGARVINLSLTAQTDDPQVSAEINKAAAKGVVLIAAAGNHYEEGNPPSYPAMYPHVIGVGAIDEHGVRASWSQVGSYVDIVAPGTGILAATPGRGHTSYDGTSLAAPFVAGTAALILQYHPELTPDQVEARLRATADVAPGGPRSAEYGAGVVNPYRAVTERLAASARPLPAPAPQVSDPSTIAEARRAARIRTRAFGVAGGAIIIVAVILLVAAVLPRGVRRRWRPGFTPGPLPGREVDPDGDPIGDPVGGTRPMLPTGGRMDF
jgi:type VII secretion-associated serine protease mycosin